MLKDGRKISPMHVTLKAGVTRDDLSASFKQAQPHAIEQFSLECRKVIGFALLRCTQLA